MPLRLSAPVIKDFLLDRTDKMHSVDDGIPTKVTIKQASQIDNERRSQVLAKNTRILDEDPSRIKIQSDWSVEELKRMEVRLTLVGCNIEAEDGKALFKFKADGGIPSLDMNDLEFERAWGKLPGDIANEIYLHVLEVNFDWSNPLMG
jgi:hypothetical protein